MSEEKVRGSKREPNAYRIFSRIQEDDWHDLGVVEATGVTNARRTAIREFGLEEEVREGTLELAVIANRFWRPVKSRIRTSEKIEFE